MQIEKGMWPTPAQRKLFKNVGVSDHLIMRAAEIAGIDEDLMEIILTKCDIEDATEKLTEVLANEFKYLCRKGSTPYSTCTTDYAYPKGFVTASPDRQIANLQKVFKGIGGANEARLRSVQMGTIPRPPLGDQQHWYAIPNRYDKNGRPRRSYEEDVMAALEALSKALGGNLKNDLFYDVHAAKLQEDARKVHLMSQLSIAQKGADILLVSAQFGLRRRGISAEGVRLTYRAHEFGLGLFECAAMLAANPRRLHGSGMVLNVDCCGDLCVSEHDNRHIYIPSFYKRGDGTVMSYRLHNSCEAFGGGGSAANIPDTGQVTAFYC
jgi:hypothetical protein